ncbi:hypothetical protein [Sulfuricurvum sp.]|uniref:hypothetical protein n=1 Tax=Sulfuricurvum sp. TaxID=2025608 RepID=UPI00262D4E60|nr:hypothetical protein [Sulfuricurvum sp.]MDD3597850.1 hypothetical protein [Sulfuricurvum sp.]
MKRLIPVIVLLGPLWAGEAAHEAPPYAAQAQSGKSLYKPVREPVNVSEETRIQQENGVMGGKNIPMHSYGNTKTENTSDKEHR